jgi:hypothetical protein
MYSYLFSFSVNFRLTSFIQWSGSGKCNDVIYENACIKCTMTVTLKKPPIEWLRKPVREQTRQGANEQALGYCV